VELARGQGQAILEARWLIDLGWIAHGEGRHDEADRHAEAAIRIARPIDHGLTLFRAEWLRHRISLARATGSADRHRLSLLRKLFLRVEEHGEDREIREFRE